MINDQTVFIVDDDPGVRQSLSSLMRTMDLESEVFGSAREFLDVFDYMPSGCLLLELRPSQSHAHAGRHAHASVGMSGLELLERINGQGVRMPAIVISADGDVPTVVRAMRAGALNFLEKPCRDQLLFEAIQECFKWNAANRRRLVQSVKVAHRLEQLTAGEYNVLKKLAEGKSNKSIAVDLSISVRAVEVRRSKLMRKMKAHSLAELIQMAMLASLPKSG